LDPGSKIVQARPKIDQARPKIDQARPKFDQARPKFDQAQPKFDRRVGAAGGARRGRAAQEAARDVRALLDLLNENEAAVETVRHRHILLQTASGHLKILDPEHGDAELINSVAAELAK